VRAVDRLLLLAGGLALIDDQRAVEPDLVIGAGLRQQVALTLTARSCTAACVFDKYGLEAAMTLRLTSPQAASVSSSAALIACMVRFMFDLMTPWNWKT